MPVLHESLERMLRGATLRGCVKPASPASSPVTEFRCSIENIENGGDTHEWSLDVVVPVGGNDAHFVCDASLHKVDTIPVFSLHQVDLPGVGEIERVEAIFHNGLFAGMWVHAGIRGHVYGTVEPRKKVERGREYVIERSGEFLREWWTGIAWSDNFRQALWYVHEPDAPRETGNEGAHAVYYHDGAVDAG